MDALPYSDHNPICVTINSKCNNKNLTQNSSPNNLEEEIEPPTKQYLWNEQGSEAIKVYLNSAEGIQLLNSFTNTNYKNVDDTCENFNCIIQDIVSKNLCIKKVNRKNS